MIPLCIFKLTYLEIDIICLKFKVTGLCLLKYKLYSCVMKETIQNDCDESLVLSSKKHVSLNVKFWGL